MTNELSLDVIHSQLRPAQKLTVSQETLDEINKLAHDPDYGEEFLNSYLDHLNLYKDNPRRTHDQYLSAIKFFSLVEAENTLTDAYIKTFPARFDARCVKLAPSERKAEIMRGEASRYNGSMLVSEIRRVATIPVSLIYRHTFHQAIGEQVKLMLGAKSEQVKQKAGACLITELRPLEEQVLNVKVEDNTTSIIDDLRLAAEKLANAEYQSVMAGVPLKTIANTDIVSKDAEYTVVEEEPEYEADVHAEMAAQIEEPATEAEVIEAVSEAVNNASLIETTLPDKVELIAEEAKQIKPKHKGRWSL